MSLISKEKKEEFLADEPGYFEYEDVAEAVNLLRNRNSKALKNYNYNELRFKSKDDLIKELLNYISCEIRDIDEIFGRFD